MTCYFVSGASSGIGREMTRQLVTRGDSVAAVARSTDRLRALRQELSLSTGRVWVHTLDVTDFEQVDRVMRDADEELGGLDVVVINAGRGGGGRIGTGRFGENRSLIETNLVGALAQAETALSLFRERRAGQVVFVSSLAADRAIPGSGAVYSATKSAVAHIGQSLRTELDGSGIEVTTLRPGYIATPLTRGNRSPLVTPVEKGVAAILAAIDAGSGDVVVPAWPWRPLGWILRHAPAGLVRRYT